ncbi:hypothetical protein [Xanthobacter tagetidis]|uniref:Uncharacterized protein n=1 Tax=Xanthobacter tagetidis TaxID=60216 RepID=A0A3L7ALV8_9HYPH|nr:hypothetical protein [Xanthobacter tagetidis]MBB6308907.1 hypothetical protein [Xanthobacter tagetidis]RLP80581.1 hypothetical protein D9R14_05910 [Xanthobacter tagetidis]
MAPRSPKAAPARAAAPADIDPAALYDVTLSRAVPVGRTLVRPGAAVRLRGDVIQRIATDAPGAVTAFERIAG